MNLKFNIQMTEHYRSSSQKIRIMSENWFEHTMFCPCCGEYSIKSYENNRPVADFFCQNCQSQFELKSKSRNFAKKIVNGAYDTMIERITSNENPDLICLNYTQDYMVKNLLLIPKSFFTPDIIEKRAPLSQTARRAGWVGCNILIGNVPEQGRIYLIKDGTPIGRSNILAQTSRARNLHLPKVESRGWLFDVLNCINSIKPDEFCIDDIYKFEFQLSLTHTANNNIKAKIRQQLQFLRDKGFIKFLGNGKYLKIT